MGRQRRKGNALIEFALISPVIFLAMFGAADFSRVIAVKTAVQNAADAAANFAAQGTMQPGAPCPPTVDISGIQQAASNDFGNKTGFSAVAVVACGSTTSGTLTTGGPCACSTSIGTYVQITTSMPFSTIAPYPGIPSSITVNGSAIVRVQ